MSDPVFDEDYICALLAVPVNLQMIVTLQTGALQALIDLYDRKVTREEFMNNVAPCVTLYGQCAKLWMLASVQKAYAENDLTEERFQQTEKSMVELIRKQSQTVIEIVKRLQLCPTSQDKVH